MRRMRSEGMKVRADPIVYIEGRERRAIDLRPDGVDCIPLLALSNFQSARAGTEYHVHPGCVEISLCRRGNLMFESQGTQYPFFPGTVFVSQPTEVHRMRSNPKGLALYTLLFRVPKQGLSILGLPADESRWLVNRLTHFPVRLFPATDRAKQAFDRLFETYDGAGRRSVSRRLKMKAAALELLLSLVDAPLAPASPKGRESHRIDPIVRRMRENPQCDYPIEMLAREVALSSVAFNDMFKRVTGLPPHAFLLDVRIKSAVRDLEDRSLPVATIAKRYGFSSPQHFATTFRRIMGVPPRRR